MTAPFEVAPRRPSPAISAMATMAGAGAADVLETKGVDAVAKSEAPTPTAPTPTPPMEPTRAAPPTPKPKPRHRIHRPTLQGQYIYAHPAPTLNSILADEAARALRDLEIEETEIDWRLLSAAAAKRGRTPSVTSNETALMTPSMSITSLASTLVDRASVHSSTTVAGSHVTEADADRYGWEESLSARSSLDSGVSEETARSFRDLGGDATPRPTAEVQERTERGFMGKRGLLWKVLTMNARGM
ncbi:hypothetical protein V498_05382 [Pseudogymnoascus sp. VKM F-4517 (FW-2822)]|nr:hypothetical protein V498_05382 [Pseudogymnoascus sp. VKM F-4517 (FW-2822)]